MSDDLKERLDVLIRTEQTGSRLLMQLGIDVLARIKDLERPCASCTSDNPCSFGALARIAELEAQLKAGREALEKREPEMCDEGGHPAGSNPEKCFGCFVYQQEHEALDPKPTATGDNHG